MRLEQSRSLRFAYGLGAGTATILCLLAFAPWMWRMHRTASRVSFIPPATQNVTGSAIEIPADALKDFRAVEAVFDNAGNPTDARPHDTPLVQPDPELGWKLRPNAQLTLHMLRSRTAYNLDPPLLAYRSGTNLSKACEDFVACESRLTVTYTVDADGRRHTLPQVSSANRILLVGDSVCFGVMVDDHQTIASHLQRQLGAEVQVVNAGVGGYQGPQCIEVARRLTETLPYQTLVYVACQNDFFTDTVTDQVDKARQVVTRLGEIRDRFSGPIVIVLTTYLEHIVHDVLGDRGWPTGFLEATDSLRRELPSLCEKHGILFVDLSADLLSTVRTEGSVFTPFAYHVDHCHLSPAGSELAARRIAEALGWIGDRKPPANPPHARATKPNSIR